MADRAHPPAKPNTNPQPSAANRSAAQPSFPVPKSQLYNPPLYRPQLPAKRRHGCCFPCFFWIAVTLLALILLIAIAGGIFFVLFRPHRPEFSVSSLRLSSLILTPSNHLTSRLDITITARNPNRNIIFLYDPISISVTSNGADISHGLFPAFVHQKKNTTVMRTLVSMSGESVDPSVAVAMKKNSIALEIDLDTNAGIRLGKLKTKKVGIKVYCEGIEIAIPKKKKAPAPFTPNASCKVKLRIKVWKWTF